MKIKELFEDINKKPHVFLDMDGVQCDLAGALQEAIGVSHYEAKKKLKMKLNGWLIVLLKQSMTFSLI